MHPMLKQVLCTHAIVDRVLTFAKTGRSTEGSSLRPHSTQLNHFCSKGLSPQNGFGGLGGFALPLYPTMPE